MALPAGDGQGHQSEPEEPQGWILDATRCQWSCHHDGEVTATVSEELLKIEPRDVMILLNEGERQAFQGLLYHLEALS